MPFATAHCVLDELAFAICGDARAQLDVYKRQAQANTLLPEEILLLIGNETEDYFLLKKENRRAGGSH